MELFNRFLRVDVLYGGGLSKSFGLTQASGFKLSVDGTALLNRTKKPNRASVSLYNLNLENQKLFDSLSDEDGIEIYCGYESENNLRKIFQGNVDKTTSEKSDRVTYTTTIEAKDGYKGLKRAFFARNYAAGTAYTNIIRDLANSLEHPIQFETNSVEGKVLTRDKTFEGKSHKILSNLSDTLELDYTTQFGTIYILDEDASKKISNPTAVLLSPNTGLVGSPKDVTKETKKRKRRKKYSFTSLINNDLTIGGLVQIQSEKINGTFIIDSLKYEFGNYSGTNFYCIGECYA